MLRLPSWSTATVAQPGAKPDIINMAVDQLGNLSIDKQAYNDVQMAQYLSNRYHLSTNVPVYITGDDQATHGRIVSVLDLVRSVGIQNASFAISSAEGAAKWDCHENRFA